ncbi:MAG: orotidine 5'-phosphate decarboxylase [Nitrososphaeraceae archaeon]|nr:orotidine 5'-phosphate decarboxylase [Nitrososphaeraceae archaeon]MDW3643695.1 orotidine 5'-phosphate decarboxylase [Nitrososphaeraceae archaeon]
MNKIPYGERIARASSNHKSFIILALDLDSQHSNLKYIEKLVKNLSPFLCAIKFNFHLILPFAKKDIQSINRVIHSHGLLSIADIKLNDIGNTNQVTVQHLHSMGFDSVIVNPIIGHKQLASLVQFTHKLGMGIISLVYMSHESVNEGYGLNTIYSRSKESKVVPLFELFLKYAKTTKVDGIVVGATHSRVLKHISSISSIPVYSPGIGTQGGNAKTAMRSGSDYLIIGRSVLNSKNKRKALSDIINSKASSLRYTKSFITG